MVLTDEYKLFPKLNTYSPLQNLANVNPSRTRIYLEFGMGVKCQNFNHLLCFKSPCQYVNVYMLILICQYLYVDVNTSLTKSLEFGNAATYTWFSPFFLR